MSGELSTDKAEYLTIKDLQMLKHGLGISAGASRSARPAGRCVT